MMATLLDKSPKAAPPTAAAPASEPEFFSRQILHARRFFLHEPPPSSPASASSRRRPSRRPAGTVIYAGNEKCAPDYHIARANLPYQVIEFVAGGEGTLTIEGRAIPLSPGTIFAYGPDVTHDIRTHPDRHLDKYFLGFQGLALHRLPRTRRQIPRPGEVIQTSTPTDILQRYEDLIAAGKRDTPYNLAICATIIEHLILRIAETAVPLGTLGTPAFVTFEKSLQYIDAHYRGLNSLAQTAAACAVDPAYLCRLFRRFAGQSPWSYVLRLKMRDAAQLLQAEPLLVRQVAQRFGYADPFQFSRTFRRVLGISPRQFLRLQRHA